MQLLLHYAGKLELHEADLLKEGSFDAAVKGAHFVFHTASPFFRCAHGKRHWLHSSVATWLA